MAGDELPEPVEEKTASHEALDLQAINGSVRTENIKEQMEIKSNALNVNIVNEDGVLVKEEEEVSSQLGISEQKQIITEKPESLEKCTLNLEQEVLKDEETSSPVDVTKAEEDKVMGETGNELHSTQITEQLSPVVVKEDGIPFLSEEIQEKTDSEEVNKILHQNQISEEDETEKDETQSNLVATLSDKYHQKELEIPIGNASQNPEDVTTEVGVPSSTIPLDADEVLEETNGKNDVLEDVQKEQIHQIETPKENLPEEKELRDETEDQSRDVPLAANSEETIAEETSQENQTAQMTCEEIERKEESTGITKLEETSQIGNDEIIPDEVSTSYDQSITNEDTSKRDEGSEQMSEDITVNDVAESTTPLILEAATGSTYFKEDAKEEALQNQISIEDETDKDAGQSTSLIELSESDNQNETVKAIENGSTNPEEVTKELDLKEDGSPSGVQEENLEEAKEKVDVAEEVQNEQIPEEVKPTEDNIAMGEKDETMHNENEENAEDLTSSHQDNTNEETGKIDEDPEHISVESTIETVTTRDVTPETEIKDAETKAPTSETDNTDIEKIGEEDKVKELSEEIELSESSDTMLKIEEASLNEPKEEKLEEDENLKPQDTDDEQEVKSCLETKEQLDEPKASPSVEEVCSEREGAERKLLNKTEGCEEYLAQNEIPSESNEITHEDEEVICDEKSGEASEILIDREQTASEGIDKDQLVELRRDDEALKENIEEMSQPTEPSNDIGASIDTEKAISSHLTTSEEVLPEISSESTTISEMEKERYEVLDSATENMEVESAHEDDPNENSTKVTESPEEDLQNRTSERSYEQEQVVSEKAIEEDGSTIASNDKEIETEKPKIGDTSSQGQEENSLIPPKDDELVLEVNPKDENRAETLNEQMAQTLEEVEEPCITQNKEELLEVENAIESKETSPDSSISTIQQDQQSEESNANQATYAISEEEGVEANVTLISGIEQSEDTTFAKEEEITTQVENTVVEAPDEETEGEPTKKLIEEIPQITAPCEITEVELGQSETIDTLTESLEVISNEKYGDNSKFAVVDAESAELESSTDESLEQKEVSIETKENDQTEFTTEKDQRNQESDVKPTEPDQATDEVSVAKNSEDNATLSAKEQIEDDKESVTYNEKDENNVIQRNDDELELQVKAEEESRTENLTIAEITQKLKEVDEEPCITQNQEKFPEVENAIESRKTSLDSNISIIQQDQQSEELNVKPIEANQATYAISEEEGMETRVTLMSGIEQIEDTTIAKEEEITTQVENTVVEAPDEETEGEPMKNLIEEIPQITAPREIAEVELGPSEIVDTLTESLEVISNEKYGDNSKSTVVDAESAELESSIDESLEQKEVSIETRENDQTEFTTEEDQPNQESDVKPTEPDQAIDEVSAAKNSEDNATLSAKEQIEDDEGSVTNSGKDENNVIQQNNDELELQVKAEEETRVENLTIAEITQKLKEVDEEPCITQNKEKLQEAQNAIESQETLLDSSISTIRQEQQSEESGAKPSEANQATDPISEEEGMKTNVTLISGIEQIGERSIDKKEEVTTQVENIVVETPDEEIEEDSTDKQIKEIPQITASSLITEVELGQSDMVSPVTENLEVVLNEEFGDATKSTDEEAKSAELEIPKDESIEQNEISIETNNSREVQIDRTEFTTEQDQPNQESDVKLTEQDQTIDEVSAVENSEDNGTLNASVEQIGEDDEGSVSNNEKNENSVIHQNDDESELQVKAEEETKANTLTIEEMTQKLEEVDEEPCITQNREENQLPEAENAIDSQETSTKEPSTDSNISTTEKDQQSEESEAKATEENQATDDISKEEGMETDVELIGIEQIHERAIAKEEVTTQVENTVVEKPDEETEGDSTEKQIEEIPQITASSLLTKVELGQSETVAPVTENLEVVSNEKFGDDTKSTDVDAKLADLEIPNDESMEKNEITIEISNARELQLDQTEFTTEQDQPNQESDEKPTEPDQAADEVSAVKNSEDIAILNAKEQIEEDEGSVANDGKDENSVIHKNGDESELQVKAEEETKAETLTYEEITQKLEDVDEEPCITQNKEELPEADNTIENKESEELDASISTLRRDQQSEESDAKPRDANQETDIISEEEGLEINETLISNVEQINEIPIAQEEGATTQEENSVVKTPKEETEGESTKKQIEEIPEMTDPSEVTEVDLSQSEMVAPATENLEVVSNEKFVDESELTDAHPKSAELESTTDEPIEPNETCVEQIGERSLTDEQGATIQKENIIVKTQKREAQEESTEEKMEEIPEITGPSEITEMEIGQSETVAPETENLGDVSNEKLGAESKYTDIDAKSADLGSTTGESTEQKEISTEPSNTREVQTEHENITEQDQPREESDVKPTEVDQATDEVSAVRNSEDNATLSASVEQIAEVEETIANKDSVILQEDDVVVKMPEEEAEKTEASNDKHMEEKIPQITNPSEVTEVELSQNEIVAPETENMEDVSDEKFGDASELTDTYSKSVELESTTDESKEHKEISTEPINTREVQIDKTEITTEQDQLNQVSEMKPTEPDEVIDEVPAVENPEVNTTLSASITGEAEGFIATEESVILQEEDVVAKMPEDEADQKVEETDEKHIEEIPQIVHPSEVTEDQLAESEPVVPEAKHAEFISDQKFGGEIKISETDLRSDQMETMVGELIGEKPSADLSSSVEQIMERSEENEGLLKGTAEQVQGEKTDAIEAVEEPNDKHIDGEFHRTADSEICDAADKELKTILTEKEVNPQTFETQTESPEQEKETEESTLAEEKSDATALISGEGQFEEIETASEGNSDLPQTTTELPDQKFSQGVEANEEPSDKDMVGKISEIIHPSEIAEVQLVESETLHPKTEQLDIVSNEKLGDESKLDETVVKLAQTGSTSDKLIQEALSANMSSSGEQFIEKSEESEVVLRSTDELVQGEKTDAEMPKEETSQGIEAPGDPCDKHIEGEILRTVDPEICYSAEEVKGVLAEKEVDPENLGTETESTEQEKTTEESTSVEEKSDATVSMVPDEGQVKVESTNRESSVVPQSTTESTESVAVPEERIPLEIDTSEEQSDKDIAGEISKVADLETHDGAVQSEIMLNVEKVDSDKLTTEIETPDLEKSIKESALVEEKSDAAANLVHGEGQIEEIEIASKESRVAPQSTIESVIVPEVEVSQGIEANEEPSDKHIVVAQYNTSVDNMEASEKIHLVQEDKVDEAQTTASSIEQHDSKNAGTEMESAFLEKTNGDIDVKADIDATSVKPIAEEKVAVINKTDNGSESVLTVEETHEEKTKLIDEKIPSDVPAETSNTTKTEELQEKEDALDTVITEPEDQTKNEDLIRVESQEEISGQEKDIANVTFEAVSEEVNTDTNLKGGDQHTENAVGKDVIGQTKRDIDVTEVLKAAEQKVAVDETNEDPQDPVPNFPEQSQEVEEEAKQSEEPEQDFASIVSSFLISKVLSEENQKIDDGMKQNNDVSSIPKALDDETIQEIATTKTEPETGHEEMLYATSSGEEAKPQIQEPEEENWEKTVEKNGEEDEVEQEYLPVSRFLMDKIMQQENKNLQEEKAIEERDKHLVSDGRIQVEEKIEESSHLVLVPEQKGETASSFVELPRDFEKGETLMGKMENTFVGDGAIFIDEVEENSAVAELTKLEDEGSRSPIEVEGDFEKEEMPAEAPKPIEDKNETLVSDVGISNVGKNEVENSNSVVVAEQEGKSISPIEAIRDNEKENKNIEQKNEALVTEGVSIIENIKENVGEVTISKQGETLYPGEVARDFDRDKPAEEKDETTVTVDDVEKVEEGGNSEVSLVEEVEDLSYRERSEDLVKEALVNAQEISNPENVVEEHTTVAMHKEEEHKNEVIVDEDTLKDVKNVEENYVFVEHEANQFEEPKEILKEEIVADEASNATISNLEEKQTNLSAEIHNDKTNLVGQVEITEKGMKNSSVSWQDIEESLSDKPKLPTATEIVKELVGNEAEFTRGEEHVKEVTDTVVESSENRSQEKLTDMEATKIEKKSEEIKNEEHEEEEEEEDKRHQEGETEIIGRDLTVKAEARETETKLAQKKSHNILSGVGSKVKHSLAKVKKAITGKSKNASPSAK